MTPAPPSDRDPSHRAPASHPDDEPLDLVFIEGFRGHTVIGIHESELHAAQPLVIDVPARASRLRARACDTGIRIDTHAGLRRRCARACSG